jgi:Spherulation-specific family 4
MLACPPRRRPSVPSGIVRACASRSSATLALFAAIALIGLAGVATPLGGAQALAAPLALIPAYFGPEGSPDPWRTMCEAAPTGSTVIVNPDNGPVKREAKVYAEPMRFCVDHGERVIGYVYTRYGKRSLATVKKAIAHYYSWYPTVEGIFLDEMAEVPTMKVETYYKQLADYVHEKGGFVVGNPGDTADTSWQLSAVDEVVTFEGSAATFATYSPAPWVLAARAQQIANIIFAAPTASQMEADCVKANDDNAGSVYVTNLPEKPNPYETLPSYWATEAAGC